MLYFLHGRDNCMDKLKELKVDDDDSNRIVDAIYGLDKNGVQK